MASCDAVAAAAAVFSTGRAPAPENSGIRVPPLSGRSWNGNARACVTHALHLSSLLINIFFCLSLLPFK